MKQALGILAATVAAGLLTAGCAASLGSRARDVETLKTQVASLETQIGHLSAQVEDLSGSRTAQAKPAASSAKESRSAKALSARQIQLALKSAGFYTGTVDGKMGPRTREAVQAFQRSNGLTPDGKVGAKTAAALAKLTAESGHPRESEDQR